MEMNVSGVHLQIGESLSKHCEEKLLELEKYSVNAVSGDVIFTKSTTGAFIHAEIVIKTAGLTVRATAESEDAYAAFDASFDKAEKQVSKYKDRIKKHNRRREESIKFTEVPVMETQESLVKIESFEDKSEDIFAEFMPHVEHKEVKNIQTLTVDEAVMQMELLHVNFFIFQNVNTKQLNVIYREQDDSNHIGWIEPKLS